MLYLKDAEAHLDDSHTTSKLGNALTELLCVIHWVGFTELLLDLLDAHANLLLVSGVSNQSCAVVDDLDLYNKVRIWTMSLLNQLKLCYSPPATWVSSNDAMPMHNMQVSAKDTFVSGRQLHAS